MNDRRSTSDHDERLSAYLAGELGDGDARALEQELADDPQLRQELDALAAALVLLAGADDAATPDGFDERLAARLAAESGVTDLAQRRRERARRSNRWMAIGTAAAVVVVGAVMGGNALRSVGSGGRDATTMSGEVAESGAGDAAGGGAAQAGPPSGPVIVTEARRIAGQAQLRRHFASLPEVQALLGVDTQEAVQVAQAYTKAVPDQFSADSAPLRSAPPDEAAADDATEAAEDDLAVTAGGATAQDEDVRRQRTAAGLNRCLTTITEGATEPLVPARIETLRYQGRRAIAYVLVTAEPGSETLDRTEVWVVAQSDCDTLVFQQS